MDTAGSEAFQWLDRNIIDALIDAPDEAFDWIFMLKDDDWPLLESIWKERPSEWREAYCYVMSQGPVIESQRILRIALFDEDPIVAAEAAQTLSYHREIEPELPEFAPEISERIEALLADDA